MAARTKAPTRSTQPPKAARKPAKGQGNKPTKRASAKPAKGARKVASRAPSSSRPARNPSKPARQGNAASARANTAAYDVGAASDVRVHDAARAAPDAPPRSGAGARQASAAPAWIPVPANPPPAPLAWREFDPRTGDWVAAGAAGATVAATGSPAAAGADPAAYAKGKTRSIVWNVLLGIDLAVLAFLFLSALAIGIMVLVAPDSDVVQRYNEGLSGESSEGIILANAILTFLMVGALPFFWVVGTRVVPWRGALRFLQLRFRPKDWLLGAALVPVMLVAVYGLVLAYACVFSGCELPEQPEESPMQDIVDNLSWPIVIVVALAAGIGEEILFRGVLQRWIGVWGQAVAFGLAHAGNAFPPQVLFAFGLGVVFGYLYRRGWSLTTLIVAHTLYDFVLLAAALLYPDLA